MADGSHAEFAAQAIELSAKAIAEWTVALQEQRERGLRARLGASGLADLRADTFVRVLHASSAVLFDEPAVLAEHVEWAKACFVARDAPAEILESNVACLAEVLEERAPECGKGVVRRVMEGAMRAAKAPARPLETRIASDAPHASLARRYVLAIVEGDHAAAREVLLGAMRDGVGVADLFERVVQPAQEEVGRLWQTGEIGVAEEHLASEVSARAVGRLVDAAPRSTPRGRTLVATSVGGDTHSFGVRLVTDAFELDGWRTYFLGASTPAPDLALAIAQREADLVALSANLGCHLPELKRVVGAIRSSPATSAARIIVGGRALGIAPDLWRKIGADAYARSTREGVALGNRLIDAEM